MFFFPTFLRLSHIRVFTLSSKLLGQQSILPKTNFKSRADDYTTKQRILLKGMFFLTVCVFSALSDSLRPPGL